MTKTANGMPSTWFGYWLGRLLCRLGIHKVGQLTHWGYTRHGDHVIRWCIRDCQWGDERWTGDPIPARKPIRTETTGSQS